MNEPRSALDLINDGIDPLTHRRQQIENNAPPSYPPDYKPSKEKIEVLEKLAMDRQEIERRMRLDMGLSQVQKDHYYNTYGPEIQAKKAEAEKKRQRDLNADPVNVRAYTRGELESFGVFDLIRLCRKYRDYIPNFEQIGPDTAPQTMVGLIVRGQEMADGAEPIQATPELPPMEPTIDTVSTQTASVPTRAEHEASQAGSLPGGDLNDLLGLGNPNADLDVSAGPSDSTAESSLEIVAMEPSSGLANDSFRIETPSSSSSAARVIASIPAIILLRKPRRRWALLMSSRRFRRWSPPRRYRMAFPA